MAAGGANALNHYLERQSDQKMLRTRQRPVASQRIPGVAGPDIRRWPLNAIAFGVLAMWANVLSAGLTLGATVFYVLVYTAYLKKRTPQNIVIGGAAGAVPPMVGWAAVTGGLDLPAPLPLRHHLFLDSSPISGRSLFSYGQITPAPTSRCFQ